MAYGRWQPETTTPVDASREHAEALRSAGLLNPHIAALAGVSTSTIDNIFLPSTTHVTLSVERAVLAVEIPERAGEVAADNAHVPILGARRRIQALIADGHLQNYLAARLGLYATQGTMAALVGHKTIGHKSTGEYITAANDRAVKALFDELQFIHGPSNRSRARGRRQGWPLPFEWDEDQIDRPDGKPAKAKWTEASAREERRELVKEMTEAGKSAAQIAEIFGRGITERTIQRDRAWLAERDNRREKVAELAGLGHTSDEIAVLVGDSERVIRRDLAWLRTQTDVDAELRALVDTYKSESEAAS